MINFSPAFQLLYHANQILASVGILIGLFSLMLMKQNLSEYQTIDFLLLLIIFIGLIYYSASSQLRYLDNDEYEHLHNAWLMHVNTLPYYSLYFTHSPLLEWIICLFMNITGESLQLLRVMRFFMFFLSCASLCLLYSIARRIFSHRHGLVCLMLILFNYVWLKKSIEIRPDNIMVFFALLSFSFLISAQLSGRSRYLLFSAGSAILSFLGKQNAAVFCLAIGLIFTYQFFEKRNSIYLKIIAGLLVAICISLILCLVPKTILMKLGFAFLMPNPTKFWPADQLRETISFTPAIFIFFGFQMAYLKKIKTNPPIAKNYIFCICAICFLFLFLMNRPWLQEMLVMIAFMALLCSDIVVRMMKKNSLALRFILFLFVLLPPGIHLKDIITKRMPYEEMITMTRDLITTKVILEISEKNDLVFDAYGKALFRHHPLEPNYLQYHPEKFSALDTLKKSGIKFLIKDSSYYPFLPEETLRWFDENFNPIKENPYIFIRKDA